MKTISYIAFTAWISISFTAYFTLTVMNKIRVEDAASNAAKNIEIVLPILRSLETGNIDGSEKALRYFLERQTNVAGRCGEYGVCNRITPPKTEEIIEQGQNYLSARFTP